MNDTDCLFMITVVSLIVLVLGEMVGPAQHAVASEKAGAKLYRHYCSPCHGEAGDGRGFNALNLDPRPANHRDAEFMSRRSDRELFDVIHGGGRAVGKSTLMPPWGETFSKRQIRSLIHYLRKLCECGG